jgi:dihydroxyacetone kinase-like predicted kinase
MTERGQVSEVHIHNMRLQSQERLANLEERASGGAGSPQGAAPAGPPKEFGFVAVASGSGMEKILVSLGVDVVVSGGQTMNPSTKDLLDAAQRVPAEQVFILPNNKNIILAANAAAEIAEKRITVIPTRSVPQSFSALFVVDPEVSFEENGERMNEAIETVHFAELTTAIKDAKTVDGQAIHSGDIIGLVDDSLEIVGSDIAAVALELVGRLAAEQADTLTLLAGADYAQEDFEHLLEEIEGAYPELELDAHRGEQPLYPLVLSAE